jgi:hypothetical protein
VTLASHTYFRKSPADGIRAAYGSCGAAPSTRTARRAASPLWVTVERLVLRTKVASGERRSEASPDGFPPAGFGV